MVLILLLYYVYVLGRKITFARAMIVYACTGMVILLLFAATMSLGEDAADALEAISKYSDYTRNAMLVIDSHYPLQYGRLTIESNTLGGSSTATYARQTEKFRPFRTGGGVLS